MKIFYSKEYGCSFFENNSTREDARKNLVNFSEIKKSPFSTNTMDYSDIDGVSIYYDISDHIKEIEIFEPNGFFLIGNMNIIGEKVEYLKSFLNESSLNYFISEENDGISINDNTIRFYIPNLDEEGGDAKVEAVVIQRKGFVAQTYL